MMMLISFILLIVFPMNAVGQREPATEPPNIILIYVDDLDKDELSCYGGKVNTPNIDRLADQGTKFTQYYPSSPVCTPSRYSVLTGEYASRNKSLQDKYPLNTHAFIRWNTDIISGDYTIPKILKQHDYKTGMVGKWHNWYAGFPDLIQVPQRADPEDPIIKKRIADNYQTVREHIKETGGFDYAEALYATNLLWLPITQKLMHHNQHWLTFHAIRFIEQNKGQPFFLYFSTTLPHGPDPINTLRNNEVRATPAGYKDEHIAVQPPYDDILRRVEAVVPEVGENDLGKYASVIWLDDAVGVLLNKLDELSIRENTIILLASDHASDGKMVLNRGQAPFITHWKGTWPAGDVEDALVSNIDMAPTVFEAAKVVPPPKMKLDGRSLLPLFNQEPSPWRESLYLEITYTRGVVTQDWKYIATRFPDSIKAAVEKSPEGTYNQEGTAFSVGDPNSVKVRYSADKLFPGYYDIDQLYSLTEDSEEQKNLAYRKEYQNKLHDMQKLLRNYSLNLPHEFGEFTQNRRTGQ